jgi:hypothetical protein
VTHGAPRPGAAGRVLTFPGPSCARVERPGGAPAAATRLRERARDARTVSAFLLARSSEVGAASNRIRREIARARLTIVKG